MPGRDRLTGQKALSGNKRSFDLNLQKVTISQGNGAKKTLTVTAKTARTLKKYGLVA